jgi:dTDP-4-amino-4,6-dideoxygalactose transaminase
MQVPFVSLKETHAMIRKEFLDRVLVLMDRSDFVLGEAVSTFEEEYARYSGTHHCIGVSNGLDALKIALRALGIGRGDEVIVPAHTYIATLFAVLDTGATPILAEPDINTYNVTATAISKAISSRTKAIIPVHMDDIMKLAKKYSLSVIEDNAQAQGATYNGKKTGSFGHINATSFYPAKNLGAIGDAGAITTADAALAHRAKLLRNVGSGVKYHHELIGYNARLDSIQAALLSCKLPHLDAANAGRKKAAERYIRNLKGCGTVILPKTIGGAEHVYHLFVIRHRQRDQLQKYLAGHEIQTLIHYPIPSHVQPALQSLGHKQGDFPITEEICRTCLSLPVFSGITAAEIDFVCEKIIAFEKHFS